MAHGQVTVPVPGELRSVAVDGRTVSADGVYDYIQQKSQEQINQEVVAALQQGGGGGSTPVNAYTKSESDNKFATKTEVAMVSDSMNTLSGNMSSLSQRVTNIEQGSGSGTSPVNAYTKYESDNKFATKTELNTLSNNVNGLSQRVESLEQGGGGDTPTPVDAYTKSESDGRFASKNDLNTVLGNVSAISSNVSGLSARIEQVAASIDSGSGVVVEPVNTADDSWNNFNLR